MTKYIIVKSLEGWGDQYWSSEGDFNAEDACMFDWMPEARAKALELSCNHQGVQVFTLELVKVNHFDVRETEELV